VLDTIVRTLKRYPRGLCEGPPTSAQRRLTAWTALPLKTGPHGLYLPLSHNALPESHMDPYCIVNSTSSAEAFHIRCDAFSRSKCQICHKGSSYIYMQLYICSCLCVHDNQACLTLAALVAYQLGSCRKWW
jgi:hypothetical protein